MCTTCGILGCVTFPNFVGQSCCNPCCGSSEPAVAGVSTTVSGSNSDSGCGCQKPCDCCCSCGCRHRACGCGG